ncbi:MAG TPA: hypothetical protein VF884_13835 [Nitrososphaeraceae archaeon]
MITKSKVLPAIVTLAAIISLFAAAGSGIVNAQNMTGNQTGGNMTAGNMTAGANMTNATAGGAGNMTSPTPTQ